MKINTKAMLAILLIIVLVFVVMIYSYTSSGGQFSRLFEKDIVSGQTVDSGTGNLYEEVTDIPGDDTDMATIQNTR